MTQEISRSRQRHTVRHRRGRYDEARTHDHLAAIRAKITVGGGRIRSLTFARTTTRAAGPPDLIASCPRRDGPQGVWHWPRFRLFCGTQGFIHASLNKSWRLSLARIDSIPLAACFDSNGGLFEPLSDPKTPLCRTV